MLVNWPNELAQHLFIVSPVSMTLNVQSIQVAFQLPNLGHWNGYRQIKMIDTLDLYGR